MSFDLAFNTSAHSKRIVQQGRKHSWEQYQEHVVARAEVYGGSFLHLFEAYIRGMSTRESWDLFYNMYVWDTIHHLSSDVLTETTKTYKTPSTRTFRTSVDPDKADPEVGAVMFEDDEQWQEILMKRLSFDYDYEMQRALTMSLAGIGTVIRPYFDPDQLDESGKPKPEANILMQVLTADQFELDLDELKPWKIRAIDYTLSQPDAAGRAVIRRFVWDSHGTYAVNKGIVKEPMRGFYELDAENNIVSAQVETDYPFIDTDGNFVLPFIPIRPFAPPDRIFNQALGSDLFQATLKANLYEQRMEWVLRNASHPHILLSGPGAGKMNDRLAQPGVPITMEGEGSDIKAEILDARAVPAVYKEAISELYEASLSRRGRSIDSFTRSGQRTTAEAQREMRAGEVEYNDLLQTFQREPERHLAEVIRLLWNTYMKQKVTETAEFYIDFGNPFVLNPYTNIAERRINVEANWESAVDVVLDLNSDIETRQEAEEKIRQNRKENRTAKAVSEQSAEIAESVPEANEGTETAPTLEDTATDQRETAIANNTDGV